MSVFSFKSTNYNKHPQFGMYKFKISIKVLNRHKGKEMSVSIACMLTYFLCVWEGLVKISFAWQGMNIVFAYVCPKVRSKIGISY